MFLDTFSKKPSGDSNMPILQEKSNQSLLVMQVDVVIKGK